MSRAKPAGGKQGGARKAVAGPSQRQLRVGEEIRHVLSGVFARSEMRDPDLAGEVITVAEVRLSPDLKNATAFVSRLGRSDIAPLLPALRRAAPFFRAELAKALRLRAVPAVSFQADTAIDYATHIGELLRDPAVARDLEPDAKSD